jgi:hypothetical protein
LGVVLRLLRFADNPGLWLDEALLAINIVEKSFSGILGSLQFTQSAPPGYLLAEKTTETLFGDAEWSLRLPSIAASVASVFFFAYVARRLLTPPAAALAIVLFAVGDPILQRAAEVHPYSVDIAVATLLAAATVWVLRAPADRMVGRAVALGVLAFAAIWFSFPSAFVVAGVFCAVGIHAVTVRSRKLLVTALFGVLLSLSAFGAVYAIERANVAHVSSAIFGAGGPSAVPQAAIVRSAWSVLSETGGFANGSAALGALLIVFGLVALVWERSFALIALLTVPPLLAVVADGLNRYPLGNRYSLFFVLSLLVLAARGAEALVSWSHKPYVVGAGVAIFLVAAPLGLAAKHVVHPPAREDMVPVLQRLRREWRPGDTLYVYNESQYALRYYSTCRDCALGKTRLPWPTKLPPPKASRVAAGPALESVPPTVIVGTSPPHDLPVYSNLELLPKTGRVWLLFSHSDMHAGLDDETALITDLERRERLAEFVQARGVRLYRFDRG